MVQSTIFEQEEAEVERIKEQECYEEENKSEEVERSIERDHIDQRKIEEEEKANGIQIQFGIPTNWKRLKGRLWQRQSHTDRTIHAADQGESPNSWCIVYPTILPE